MLRGIERSQSTLSETTIPAETSDALAEFAGDVQEKQAQNALVNPKFPTTPEKLTPENLRKLQEELRANFVPTTASKDTASIATQPAVQPQKSFFARLVELQQRPQSTFFAQTDLTPQAFELTALDPLPHAVTTYQQALARMRAHQSTTLKPLDNPDDEIKTLLSGITEF